MSLFKVTLSFHGTQQGMVSYYIDKETPKAAYEHGLIQWANIFGDEQSEKQVRVEQDHPT